MKRKFVFITILLLAMLFLSACDVPFLDRPLRDNPERRYYEGTEGVLMQFSSPSNPPTRMFYHSDMAPTENEFNIFIDLHNLGTSYTYGALFVSGYDPGLVDLYDEEGLPLGIARYGGTWSDCTMDFGLFGAQTGGNFWDSVSGVFNCADTGAGAYYTSRDNWGVQLQSLAPVLDLVGIDSPLLDNVGFTYDNNAAGNRLRLNVQDGFNLDYLNHGRGIIVMLSGLSFRQYNGQEYYLKPDLPDYPGGERTTIAFTGQIRDFPSGLDETRVPIMVTNCYLYTTYAAPQVCIDPDPYSQQRKVCRPREINFGKGTGAPLVISSVEQQDISKKGTWFVINLKNAHEGRGTIYDMGALEQCSPYHPKKTYDPALLDRVYLVDARIGDTHLECSPERFKGVHLDNGRGEVRCYYPFQYETAGSAYETSLILEFAYGYAETLTRYMTVKRAY